ncbi:MAG: hypothetical protein PHG89_06735 [Gallionella sp.]|nr:hypothetical protein [Gallionella sp.]
MKKIGFEIVGASTLIAVICTALTGCHSKGDDVLINRDAIISELTTRLTSKMKDPSSVQFRNITLYPTTLESKDGKKLPLQVAVCGEVNRTVNGDGSEYNPFISTDTLTISEGVPTLAHSRWWTVMINSAPRGGGYFEEVAADVCQNETRPPREYKSSAVTPAKNLTQNPVIEIPSTNQRVENSSDVLDRCFMAGKSFATVYISDMARYSSGGLMPSTLMQEGCSREGASAPNPQSCISQCELGFKKVAREALK